MGFIRLAALPWMFFPQWPPEGTIGVSILLDHFCQSQSPVPAALLPASLLPASLPPPLCSHRNPHAAQHRHVLPQGLCPGCELGQSRRQSTREALIYFLKLAATLLP